MSDVFGYVSELFRKGLRILRAYGVLYFLRRTFKFFKRYKWRSFLAPEDLNSQYQKWLEKNDEGVGTKGIAGDERTARENELLPLISIVILLSKFDKDSLKLTVDSILRQDAEQWVLLVVDDGSSVPDAKEYLTELSGGDNRIVIVNNGTGEDLGLVLKRVVNNLKSEYVLLLEDNGVLRSDAIGCFAREASESNYPSVIYGDEDTLDNRTRIRLNPAFKPGWSPNLLYSFNYVGSPVIVRKELLKEVGGFRQAYDGCLNYELLLRLTDYKLDVRRIPRVLFSKVKKDNWRDEVEAKDIQESRAVRETLFRKGYDSRVTYSKVTDTFTYRLNIMNVEPVSIIIPTKNNAEVLRRCLESIQKKSTYSNYEIIVIDNGSTEEDTLNYLNSLEGMRGFRVLRYPGEFNYPDINNFGASEALGSYLVFLNDDTEVISADWMEALLEHSQMPEVGAVGALLLFPGGLIQHAGVVIGMRGSASHAFYKCDGNSTSYMNLACCVRNVSAVTAACLMIEKTKFNRVGGFNTSFRVAMNDIDLCIRLLSAGFYNIYTPHARLLHHESLTRGEFVNEEEIKLFTSVHREFLERGDPYYHPALSLERNDYSLAV
ncbi:glycosyltransferase family 2 protein [Phosphitispora fastidiosa]|uniref:glycosyltransferase family 2 protein n=1 Tax=Phosphitispora fastidiosa TaxID=2837202 RepID=UPI001E3C468D|nr:glycosyltransferase family 2 protein [Phosphitispora fastidiosa]MBU7008164.1 GT2 family glycosyltransferase [Phosphitispora fastidiosa]